jgi:release factor glutamine methyltransferase
MTLSNYLFLIPNVQLFDWYQKVKLETVVNDISLFELEYLLTELTILNKLNLKLNSFPDDPLIKSKISFEELQQLWILRVEKRWPIQYLIGECHWRNFTLKVTSDVLIPRPETELMIDRALQLTREYPHLRCGKWLDLGTGSGAIALGLAEIFPKATIYAVDKSEKALKIAEENAVRLGFSERIKFYHGSWFKPLDELKNSFSGIISNPPYIPSKMVLELQPEVLNHEPKMALDGGEDGLNEIRELINNASDYLISNGFFLLEIMAGQGDLVKDLLVKNGQYYNIQIEKDFANLDRMSIAQFY